MKNCRNSPQVFKCSRSKQSDEKSWPPASSHLGYENSICPVSISSAAGLLVGFFHGDVR